MEVGDWVTWVRDDLHAGQTGCEGAAALASQPMHNDFVYGTDTVDEDTHDDVGGLVRLADTDGDGVTELFTDFEAARMGVSTPAFRSHPILRSRPA